MPSPLDASVLVGYVEAEDVYIVFSEYYGDGTIYGRREMFMPSGELIHGAGKTWSEIAGMGALVADEVAGAVNGHLVHIPVDVVVAPAEVPVEVPPVEAPKAQAPFTVRLELCGTVVTYENVKHVDIKTADGTAHTFF